MADAAVVEAFHTYEAQQRIANTKVGCALVVTLMPLGSTADYFVYREKLWSFFWLRVACDAIATIIWALLFTDKGRKIGKWLGVIVPLLPVVFLAWMIAVTEGFDQGGIGRGRISIHGRASGFRNKCSRRCCRILPCIDRPEPYRALRPASQRPCGRTGAIP